MRFGRTLVSFIGLTVMLLCAELWLRHGLAAQGSRIVFTRLGFDNLEIYVMDADGGNQENMSNHPLDDMEPDWSPGGAKIAFASNRSGAYQIYVMDGDGNNQIRLTNGPREKRYPDWSPNGRKIVFTVDGVEPHIDMMDADGQNRERLENFATEPSWSPDGQQIAFLSWRDGGDEIYVIDADGMRLKQVTGGISGGHSPSFSPDGRRIAYYGSHEGFKHIFVMGANGKNRQRLTHDQTHHSHPTWSPDGGAIAYVISKDLFFEDATIHLMTAEGKYLKQLTDVHIGIDYQPDFIPVGLAVSPTSKTASIWGRLKTRATNLR